MPESLGEAQLELSTDNKGFNQGIDSALTRAQGFGKKLGGIGKVMTAGVTAPLVGIAGAAFAAGNSVDEAMAIIQTGTGATGDALADLQESFETVFKAVPDDAQAVADVIAVLNTTLGLTGDALDDAALATLNLANSMGIDATKLIDDAAKAINIFGREAGDITPILDTLFTISQNTGIGVDVLAGQMTTFGPVTKNLGLSLEETAQLFGQMNEGGIEVSRVFPGINAFMRRTAEGPLKDLNEGLGNSADNLADEEDALESNLKKRELLASKLEIQRTRLGEMNETTKESTKEAALLSYKNAVAELSELDDTIEDNRVSIDFHRQAVDGWKTQLDEAEGSSVDLRQEMDNAIEAIKGATDETGALNIATELFGAEGAQRLTVGIRNGVFSLEDLTAGLEDSEGAIADNTEATRTAAEEMAILKNEVTLALAPIGVDLLGAFQSLMPFIMDVAGALATAVRWFSNLSPRVQAIIGGILGVVAVIGPLLFLLPGIIAMVTILTAVSLPWLLGILAIAAAIAAVIAIIIYWEEITNDLMKAWDDFVEAAVELWDGVKAFFVGLWDSLVQIFKDNWALILAILFPPVGIAALIFENWGAITGIVEDIWDRIKDVFKAGVNFLIGLAEGWANSYINAVNAIIRAINSISISIPDWVPGIGGMSWSANLSQVGTISLPRLAEGGFAMSPTFALVGDVPEAIIPLDRMGELGLSGSSVNIYGDIYGWDDFVNRVQEANNFALQAGYP